MRRPGCDEQDVKMSDVLCDFCRREWSDALPMVEGHQGSCICGECLAEAYRAIVLLEVPAAGRAKCTLCLEEREDPAWRHPGAAADGAPCACRRCVRQSAAVLQKDADSGWRKPQA